MLLSTIFQLGLSRELREDMVMNSRTIWELTERVQMEKYRYEIERTRLDAMNWILPIRDCDRILKLEMVTPKKPSVPPPSRYRRN